MAGIEGTIGELVIRGTCYKDGIRACALVSNDGNGKRSPGGTIKFTEVDFLCAADDHISIYNGKTQ